MYNIVKSRGVSNVTLVSPSLVCSSFCHMHLRIYKSRVEQRLVLIETGSVRVGGFKGTEITRDDAGATAVATHTHTHTHTHTRQRDSLQDISGIQHCLTGHGRSSVWNEEKKAR